MKKIILTLLGTFFTTAIVFAQSGSDARESLAIGGKIGLNYSNIYDSQSENFDANPKIGFVAGGFLSIPIGKYFGIQPEVLYSQRGFTASGTFLGSRYDLNRTLSFLDIPILFAIKPTQTLTVLFGPQYSYLLKQRDEFSNSFMTTVQEQEFKNDNIRRNLFCLTGGVDFNFKNLVLGVRTGLDMTNNKGDGTSTTPRYKNIWVQGTVGFRIY